MRVSYKLRTIALPMLAILTFLVVTGGFARAQDKQKLAVQVYSGLFMNLIPWVAQSRGYYEKHGLDVDLVSMNNGPQGLAALEGGSIQLALNNTDVMILADEKGLDLQMVSGNWGQQFSIFARQGLKLPHASQGYPAVMKDFVGKKVGVAARGSGTEIAMRATLAEAGLAPDSVAYVAVGGTTGQVPALRSARVDFVVVPMEGAAVLKAMDLGTSVVDFQKGEGPQSFQRLTDCYDGFFGKRSWIVGHEDTLKRFIAANKEAEAWARNPANLTALSKLMLQKAPKAGVPDPMALAENYLKTAPYQTRYDEKCVSGWNDMLLKNKLIQKPIDPAKLVWKP